jgi:hypothetical protein
VSALQQRSIVGQARERKAREARLARAHELPLPTQLEVDLGEAEAIGVVSQRAQPPRLLRTEQQAQRGVLAAADAPAQLV